MITPSRIAEFITDQSALVIVVLLLVTGALGAGIPLLDDDTDLEQFESESPEVEAAEYIDEHFSLDRADDDDDTAPGLTSLQLIARGENVLSQESILDSLELQQTILDDEAIAPALAEDTPFTGVETIIGTAALEAIAAQENTEPPENPTITDKHKAVQSLDTSTYNALLADLLEDDGSPVRAMLSTNYEPGSVEAEARMTTVAMVNPGEQAEQGFSDAVLDAQLEIREYTEDRDEAYLVFGAGIIFHELDQSLSDSLAIVGPFALLFVVFALVIAYRDLVDILLGLAGIILVLIWTFGFMGWSGIPFNQMMIAVPVLLIGLSIDYAIHVFMRHREQREAENGASTNRSSMTIALAGVGIALIWVTATMALGFLANLASPIGALGEFGIASAFGIVAALVIFGALIPALKIYLDDALERIGLNRRKQAFGTGGGRFSNILSAGVTVARKAPLATVVVVLLLTTGGIIGATQVETSFDEEDFLTDEPPTWTSYLPGFMQPAEYSAASDLEFINEHFEREDLQAQLLIRGEVTHAETLTQMRALHSDAEESPVVFQRPGEGPVIDSVYTRLMGATDASEEFAALVDEHDTTGDGLPDEDLQTIYDALLEIDPEAATVLATADDGSYNATQLVFSIRGDAEFDETTSELRSMGETLESGGGADWDVIATGDPIISHVVESDLLVTVMQTLLLTLGAVLLFLALAYWLTGNTLSLGLVTVTPVIVAVSWILGSMYLLEIPFNVLTGMITSLTIGLGVAYSIHISSRYTLELRRGKDMWTALETTVTGTGGALFGSAATTIGAFGTLSLATFPVLRQFGLVTGLTILYAFLASVFVLPVLLVLWTRYARPEDRMQPTTDAVQAGESS